MAKANSGWHKESLRHSNARRFGKAMRCGLNPNYIDLKKANIPDSQFDKKNLAIGMKIESEHSNNPAIQKAIAKAHLSEDKAYYQKLKQVESQSYQPLTTIKAPPLKQANNLPVQVSVLVPSTKEHSKKIGKRQFHKRVDETKEFMDKEFGGDTKVDSVGSYFDGSKNELIKEESAVVESSMSIPTYNKKIKKVVSFIEKKRKDYGQDTMLLSVEGHKYIIPKKDYIDNDKKTTGKRILVS